MSSVKNSTKKKTLFSPSKIKSTEIEKNNRIRTRPGSSYNTRENHVFRDKFREKFSIKITEPS